MSNNIQQHVEEISKLVNNGNDLEAIEKYFAEDVVVTEHNDLVLNGRQAYYDFIDQYFKDMVEFRSGKITQNFVKGEISVTVSEYNFNHKQMGEQQFTQASVAHWKDGKIVKVNFYAKI